MKEMTLGQRIKLRRKQIGISQKGLSKAVGVSDSSISLWESDHTAPRGENLHELASALQCSPTWILFGDEDKNPDAPRQLDDILQLTDDELEMLRLYRGLPESERTAQMSAMKTRVKNHIRRLNALLDDRSGES
jgi:transcriptional regulator with XRE-family HTH domain